MVVHPANARLDARRLFLSGCAAAPKRHNVILFRFHHVIGTSGVCSADCHERYERTRADDCERRRTRRGSGCGGGPGARREPRPRRDAPPACCGAPPTNAARRAVGRAPACGGRRQPRRRRGSETPRCVGRRELRTRLGLQEPRCVGRAVRRTVLLPRRRRSRAPRATRALRLCFESRVFWSHLRGMLLRSSC